MLGPDDHEVADDFDASHQYAEVLRNGEPVGTHLIVKIWEEAGDRRHHLHVYYRQKGHDCYHEVETLGQRQALSLVKFRLILELPNLADQLLHLFLIGHCWAPALS